ncbi:MAG: hypothetical protein ACK5Z3_14235, partial [Pseudanabaena sp.]
KINNIKKKINAPLFVDFFFLSTIKTQQGVAAQSPATRFIAILNGLWKDTPSGCPSTNQKNPQMI